MARTYRAKTYRRNICKHGGGCDYCTRNRTISQIKALASADDDLRNDREDGDREDRRDRRRFAGLHRLEVENDARAEWSALS